jgi:hypothetical protein
MPKGNDATTPGATTPGATTNGATTNRRPDEGAIAKRAYELFLQRGSIPGYEVDDWLQAEAELLTSLKNGVGDRPRSEPPAAEAPNNSARRPTRERGAPRRAFRQPQSQ